MTNSTSHDYKRSRVRVVVEVEVSHESTDSDEDIKEVATLRRNRGTVTDAEILERDVNSG
jgi:hypothetical protein